MRTKIFLILLFSITILFAENPSSGNYILQQTSIGSGSDPANPPTSANYILKGSSVGTISGEKTASSNYSNFPGYYLGEITGEILPPENVVISVIGMNVQLSWSGVSGATSYKVYSSDNPNSGFLEDTSGTFVDESWSAPASDVKKFYYVKAVN
ncbi:MAG: hypothetical protein K8S23_16705 [Candidatus Cloacimonetes bacterium]|nr:hypothetical protein [Candidatus Cloacimonadota bacterium]